MILRGYGIELVRLKAEHLELLRMQRNSGLIRPFMIYRDDITPEMQQQWFRSIDNKNNGYYLIRHEGGFVGLINGSQIDWEKKSTGSGGIFLWEPSLWKTSVPVSASLLLTDLSFLLGLERTYIQVLRSNADAIRYNRMLGYEPLPEQPAADHLAMVLTEEAYLAKAARFRLAGHRLYGEGLVCIIDDPEHEASQNIIAVYARVPEEKKRPHQLIVL